MANTYNWGNNFFKVLFDGSTDFDLQALKYPTGLKLLKISYLAAVAGTKAIVREGSATACPIFERIDIAGGGVSEIYAGKNRLKIYVVGNEVLTGDKMIFEFVGYPADNPTTL